MSGDEKQLNELNAFKSLCEQALEKYPQPPLANNYKQNLQDLIDMANMYIEELEDDLECDDEDED